METAVANAATNTPDAINRWVFMTAMLLFRDEALVRRPSTDGAHVPVASVTHFLVKLVFAAPASFLSAAWVSQAASASFVHFVMKLVFAAPARFLAVA